MDVIRLAYSDLINAGDLFNKQCVETLSKKEVVRSKTYNADMIAIGGALVGTQYFKEPRYRIVQRLIAPIYANKPLYVWGSGFLRDDNDRPLFRKNLVVCALRGQKTQNKLSKLMGKELNVPLADGGLVIDSFATKLPPKKYDVGIIPHFSQRNSKSFLRLEETFQKSHMIDIRKSPVEVAEEIAQCDVIISSSLHGLVFADSLHIPSIHVMGETELAGGMYKFQDYYSAYGLQDDVWRLTERIPTINDVYDNYKIDSAIVDRKKKELLNVFPKF